MSCGIKTLVGLFLLAGPVLIGAVSAESLHEVSAPGYSVDYLIHPSPFHGIHGSDFDADGNLLIGDIAGFSVHRVDVDTGLTSVVAGPYDGLSDDVKVAPDNGQIVWTTAVDGRIISVLPSGEQVTLAADLPGINAIAFHPDGRLFATQLMGNDIVWEVDRTGVNAPRRVVDNIGGMNGFVIADDGYAYGPVGAAHSQTKIIRLDFDTGEIETVADGFSSLAAVKMDPTGLLYASDLLTGEIWEVNKASGHRRLVADLEYFVDNITVREDGLIFAAETSTNSIVSIDPSTGKTHYVIKGQIPVAEDVALGANADGTGYNLYVGGLYAAAAIELTEQRVMPFADNDPAALEFPSSMTVHGEHLVWSAWFGGLVKVVNRFTGDVIRRVEGLAQPRDVLMTPNGGLLIVEQRTNRILLLAPDDDSRSVLVDGLDAPMGMIWDGPDHILVTETGSGVLSRISLTEGARSVVADGFLSPEGLTSLNDSAVAVVDAGTGQVVKVELDAGETEVIVDGLNIGLSPPPPLPRSWLKSGIAVEPDGTLYVTSDIETSVYRLVPEDLRQ